MANSQGRAVKTLRISGSPHQRGAAHGAAIAHRLRTFLDDGLARLHHLSDQRYRLEDLRERIEAHRQIVTSVIPDLAAEIDGVATGAGLSRDEAWLLQLRREILGYHRFTTGDCTTYSSTQGTVPILAQTVDLNGNLDDQVAVLEVQAGRRSLILSFAGLLGYLGVNDAGVAVGINLVLGGRWQPGVPPYLAVRHVLDTATCVEEAIATLQTLPLSSSRAFTICDGDRIVCVEALEERRGILEDSELIHTNHYLHPPFALEDEINPFALTSSKRRWEAVRGWGIPQTDDPEAHRKLLASPPVCVADNGDIRRERTVAAIAAYPTRGQLTVWPGNPANAPAHLLQL
ncbi:C45 family autoproteolytic acyltransferase/hydolase [Natronoglycomyces albus]|uniref:Peptidase C45 hydrolase domain-containing protein n=1 Tax=Natronoglycomyces albus TaxID=2811108 RepID=A0A895XMH9_9ACTN|nr:C45 family peptidase [Natronoglycomyces albus]QSB06871.1 hypothetical protein JQS30_08290 [Natronoglycomyces albus]